MMDINVKIVEKFIDFNKFEMDNVIIFLITFFYSVLILEIYTELLHKERFMLLKVAQSSFYQS